MWILSCEGDILGGKRFLLRPGEEHLFGRTKQDQKNSHAIDNKSVSRKHLSISVTPTSGQGHNPKAKSTITLRDDSKIGTLLNGEKFKQTTRTLSNDLNEYTLQLGSFEQKLKITWQPVVLTFAMSSKWIKDHLDGLRTRLEAIDVRSITNFIHGTTTHVIAEKRNTSKGLQALVSANYIVTEDYPEEIIKAATVPLSGLESGKASLEIDFDGRWPPEIDFLPPQGKEPVPRPASFFAPDVERNDIFAKFTFVFGDKSQFDNLQSPINMGGGKALLFQVDLGETTPEQFATRVRELAGEEQDEEEGDGLRKHVVVVHHRLINGHDDWIKQFTHDLERRLGQRSIEQNEFLDAILTKDVNNLHRPLEEDPDIPMSSAMSEPSSRPPASGVEDSVEFDTTQPPSNNTRSRNRRNQPEVQVPSSDKSVEDNSLPRRRFRRGQTTTSRFTGFGEFDPSSIQKVEYDEDNPSQASASMSRILEEDSQPSMVRDSHGGTQTRTTRKRRGPPLDDGSPNEEDVVNGLLPATAAMKRRRIAEGHPPTSGQKEKSPSPQPTARMAAMKRKTKAEKEIDVREFARQRREAEEEAARKDAEALERALDGMEIDQIKDLVQIEEMEIPARRSKSAHNPSDHWDERWNGRKNFKKFRRKGTGTGPIRGQRVIVPIVEVKRKDFGISDDLLADELIRSRSSKTGSKSNTQQSREQEASKENAAVIADSDEEGDIISIHSAEDEEDQASPAPPTRASKRKSDPDSHSQKSTSRTIKKPKTAAGVPDSVNSSRTSRSTSRRTTPTPQSIPETVISETQTSRSTRGKKSAAASAREAPGKKKTRSFVRDSDGSDDDLAFAFGRRRA